MSESRGLYLRRVHVKRTPGIGDPFRIDDLCSGVNIVFGPNASGKTSTARAIEALLWPGTDAARDLEASAHYDVGGASYLIDLDSGRFAVQRDGVSASPPVLPAPDFRDRYRLSLHDLLVASEHGDRFAREIALQSAGGYDFAAAAKRLNFGSRLSLAKKELDALHQAKSALKLAQDGQQKVYADAQRLGELQEHARVAGLAGESMRLMDAAIHRMECQRTFREAQDHVATFPPELALVRGDELDQLEELGRRLEVARRNEAIETASAAAAVREANAALPEGPIQREHVIALGNHAAALAQAEQAIQETGRRRDDIKAQVASTRQAIGQVLSDEQLIAVNGDSFGDLAAFSLKAELLQGQVAAADAEIRLASEGEAVESPALEKVNAGLRLLFQWLREPDGTAPSHSPKAIQWALVLLAIAGWSLIGLNLHPAAWTGAILSLALGGFLLFRSRPTISTERPARERDYTSLGLKKPARWTADQVTELVDRLQQDAANLRMADRRDSWLRDARGRRKALDQRVAALEEERSGLVVRLGVAPGSDARQLAWIASHLVRWREAWTMLQGAEAALSSALRQQVSARAAAGEAALAMSALAPETAADAAALARVIDERTREHAEALRRAEEATQRCAVAAAERGDIEGAIARVYDICRVTREDLPRLREFCEKRPTYQEATDAALRDQHQYAAAEQALEKHAGFEPFILEMGIPALFERREAAAELATRHESLVKEVAELNLRVQQAKQSNNVEGWLADVALCEENLRQLRQGDLASLIGDALVQEVQRKTRDEHRPVVFRRARELFAVMTAGRYRLDFEDGESDGAAFRALDATTGRGHAMAELSSATRVQLLLAVRLAFVEVQEGDIRLPLFLDEALGTSDEMRAAAVIDAIVGLANAGRQVFYFTAQMDEVAKWRLALETSGTAHLMIDLASLRRGGSGELAEIPSIKIIPELVQTLPPLDGLDHPSLGEALQIPPIRIGSAPVEATPLWYLIDDVICLHALLSVGVATWGALENLIDAGEASIVAAHPGVLERVRARARMVAVMHQEASIGRVRRVDVVTLEESGAVSKQKIDEVGLVAEQCDGDAARLLAALDGKKVKGFHEKKILELREYFEEAGYISTQLPRTMAEIRLSMMAALGDAIAAGVAETSDADFLLRRIESRASGYRASMPGEAIPAFLAAPASDVLSA